MMDERQRIEQAIAAQESLRATVGFKNGEVCTSAKLTKSPSKWGELATSAVDFVLNVGQKNSPTACVKNTLLSFI